MMVIRNLTQNTKAFIRECTQQFLRKPTAVIKFIKNLNFLSILSHNNSVLKNRPYTIPSCIYMLTVFLFLNNFPKHFRALWKPLKLLFNNVQKDMQEK